MRAVLFCLFPRGDAERRSQAPQKSRGVLGKGSGSKAGLLISSSQLLPTIDEWGRLKIPISSYFIGDEADVPLQRFLCFTYE